VTPATCFDAGAGHDVTEGLMATENLLADFKPVYMTLDIKPPPPKERVRDRVRRFSFFGKTFNLSIVSAMSRGTF